VCALTAAPPIEDYALLGDLQTAALVSRRGTVDWLCLPRFDSPACFAALVHDESAGTWQLAPEAGGRATRRCGVPKSCTMALTWASSCLWFVFVDQAIQDGPARDADMASARDGAIGSRWAELLGAVRTAVVVVGDVSLQHGPQVSLVDDQEPVGELPSHRADEPFGITIRPRAARRDLYHLDTCASEHRIER
jgi:hypothetical protein